MFTASLVSCSSAFLRFGFLNALVLRFHGPGADLGVVAAILAMGGVRTCEVAAGGTSRLDRVVHGLQTVRVVLVLKACLNEVVLTLAIPENQEKALVADIIDINDDMAPVSTCVQAIPTGLPTTVRVGPSGRDGPADNFLQNGAGIDILSSELTDAVSATVADQVQFLPVNVLTSKRRRVESFSVLNILRCVPASRILLRRHLALRGRLFYRATTGPGVGTLHDTGAP